MQYIIVTDGCDYGALEIGKPIPHGFHQTGEGNAYESKEACQEWVDDEIALWESLSR